MMHDEIQELRKAISCHLHSLAMPGEFARYKPGMPFEAVVARDPIDSRLLQVVHIRRIDSLPKMSDDEFRELIESLPTTESLPKTNWD